MTAATMRLMRKLFLFVLLTLSVAVYGRRISPEEATGIAKEFFNSASVWQQSPKTGVHRAQGRDASDAGGAPFYVFNADGDKGFVIVSGDDRVPRILGYSDKINFDFNNLPPQLAAVLDNCKANLDRLPDTVHASWKGTASSKSTSTGKLLETASWGQFEPYNLYTPEINGTHCPTGCVATAMAIVMRYNEWPKKPRGGVHKWLSHGSELSYNFDEQEFDFSKMPNLYTEGEYTNEQANEVSKLMQAVGASVNMQYDLAEGSALSESIGHRMYEFFKYSPLSQSIFSSKFSQEEWLKIIFEQIDNNHPLIISGFYGEYTGHAFVCDGYDENEMLHINWGWDGSTNGYFEPFLLNGYNAYISMNINLYNDECTTDYSRIWVSDGGAAYHNYKYKFGLTINKEKIQTDEPFSVSVQRLNIPNDYKGNIGFALIDANGKIVEIIENQRMDCEECGSEMGFWGPELRCDSIFFHSEITPDMSIQLVAKEDGQDWKQVLGAIDAPTNIPVVGHTPVQSTITLHTIDPDNIVTCFNCNNEVVEKEGTFTDFAGTYWDDINYYKVSGGIAYAIINGVWRSNASDFSQGDLSISTTTTDPYDITIYANRYENLIEKTVNLTEAGTLSSKISREEQPLVYRLKVSGPMNADDYAFITRQLYSLKHLDVENTTIKEGQVNRYNYMPKVAGFISEKSMNSTWQWGLESIRLPKELIGMEDYSCPLPEVELLEIPGSVKYYGDLALYGNSRYKFEYIKVNNPIPAKISPYTFDVATCDYNYTTLIVPYGSKSVYETADNWNRFNSIIESDVPYVGQYVDYEDCRYDVITDFAIVSGKYGDKSYCVLPNEIEYEGTKYPIKSCARHFQVNNLYLDNVDNFTYTVNSVNVPNIFTNRLIPNVNISQLWEHTWCNLWVPGGVNNNYSNSYVYEMWSYKIDKNNKLLSIIPQCDLSIDKLIIDGKEVAVTNNGLYAFSDPENLKVELTYTLYGGQHTMTTTYPAEFNSKMESTELRVPCTSISLSPESWSGVEGESFQITATVIPEDATDKTLSWGSSDENIATVNDSGLVSLIKQGLAVITASATDGSGVFAKCNVIVSDGSGIVDVSSDKSAYVRIFNMQGMQVYEGLYSEAKLVPDYYIISCNGKSLKVRVE